MLPQFAFVPLPPNFRNIDSALLAAAARLCGTVGLTTPDREPQLAGESTILELVVTPVPAGHRVTVVPGPDARAAGPPPQFASDDDQLLKALVVKAGGSILLDHGRWQPHPGTVPGADGGFEPESGPTVTVTLTPDHRGEFTLQAAPSTAAKERRDALTARAAELFRSLPPDWRPAGSEYRHTDSEHLERLPSVPLLGEPHTVLLVDEPARLVWYLTISTVPWRPGSRRALAFPLTGVYADIVVEFRAENADPPERFTAQRDVDPHAARLLAAAGWSIADVESLRAHVRVETSADARAVVEHSPFWWAAHGWSWTVPGRVRDPVPAADAVRLTSAGISGERYYTLRRAGFGDIEAALAARPPAIPDAATRVLFLWDHDSYGPSSVPDGGIRRVRDVYTDPETARSDLALDPSLWRPDLLEFAAGPRPVHATDRWSYWSDGSVIAAVPSLGDSSHPAALPPVAVDMLDLVVGAENRPAEALWRPLLDATGHTSSEVAQGRERVEYDGGVSTTDWTVTLHTFTLPDGSTRELWQRSFYGRDEPDVYDWMNPMGFGGYTLHPHRPEPADR